MTAVQNAYKKIVTLECDSLNWKKEEQSCFCVKGVFKIPAKIFNHAWKNYQFLCEQLGLAKVSQLHSSKVQSLVNLRKEPKTS